MMSKDFCNATGNWVRVSSKWSLQSGVLWRDNTPLPLVVTLLAGINVCGVLWTVSDGVEADTKGTYSTLE
jgi:hypothetical protein